jgi:hypothetical protein
LTAGVQGLNNARAIISGSLYFFSNDAFEKSDYGNQQVVQDLLNWVIRKRGLIRVKSMSYHGIDTDRKESLFNVG